jgi:hypothetical protein
VPRWPRCWSSPPRSPGPRSTRATVADGLNIAISARPDKEERIVARRLAEHRVNMLVTVEGMKSLCKSDRPTAE